MIFRSSSLRHWALATVGAAILSGAAAPPAAARAGGDFPTDTPIKHVVIIFQENISFDHYFATYPKVANSAGEPHFTARDDTPSVNGLTGGLLSSNQNEFPPFRLSPAQAVTCDMDHDYSDEQKAVDMGLLDKFVQAVGRVGVGCRPDRSTVMGYYDGNTVTALWNYAQHFAMNDNSFGTVFGPSTPGALNLISGQTHGATPAALPGNNVVAGSVTGDPRPVLDDCSPGGGGQPNQIVMSGRNVGDLLNAKNVTWGWFQGGFKPTGTVSGKAVCGASHTAHPGVPNPTDGQTSPPTDVHTVQADYIPHHQPFQYYPQTVNPHHLRPSSVAMIGKTDQANHQYDLSDFFDALKAGSMPAVSFLKAAAYQDGHAGYSDPLSEQTFLVQTINTLQQSPEWRETAVIIAYDDSDGWYDHVTGPIVNPSSTASDFFAGPGNCGAPPAGALQARCGHGPRLPLLVISPWAKANFVDHTTTDQSSILRFIEDNWDLGFIDGTTSPPAGQASFDRIAGTLNNMFDFDNPPGMRPLILDPTTGAVLDRD